MHNSLVERVQSARFVMIDNDTHPRTVPTMYIWQREGDRTVEVFNLQTGELIGGLAMAVPPVDLDELIQHVADDILYAHDDARGLVVHEAHHEGVDNVRIGS